MRKEAMGNRPIEKERRFYTVQSDVFMKARFGISAVFVEFDTGGDVRRFVGVDDDGKPLGRWPSRMTPPFVCAHGVYSEKSVPDDEMIAAVEFEAKWAEADAVVGQHDPWGSRVARLVAAVLRRCRGR